jgi:hypothetical protein
MESVEVTKKLIRHAQTLDRVEQDGDDEHKGDHVFHPDLL